MAIQPSTTTDSAVAPPPSHLPILNLASCNTATRSKALKHLATWLPTQPHISDEDMNKLWKGLFYCVWHADKLPVQTNLNSKLANMLLTLDVPLALHYLSVFFTTLRREWSGIDVLRLDKFLLLIRFFVNSSFNLLKRNAWDIELCKRVMNIYEEKSLLANDRKFLGNGVNYQIAAVFVKELRGYLPVKREVCEVLLSLLFKAMSVCHDKVLVGKIKGRVFDKLLKHGRRLIEVRRNGDGDVASKVVNLGTIGLKLGLAGRFYELGSSSECFQGNRKVLFGLNKEFVKLEKELEASGVDVQFPSVECDDGDEDVPDLVPIVAGSGLLLEGPKSGVEGSKKSSKKKKKKTEIKENADSEKQETGKENGNGDMIITNETNDVTFTEIFSLNLQKEFEKVAEEDGMDKDGESTLHEDLSTITISSNKASKKRKRAKSVERRESNNAAIIEQSGLSLKSGEKSAKKVRFSKNNLVWKPQSPLPPQSLRIPPSVTPRGSALKKGVPPGPVREMPRVVKKAKKKKMKVRKVMKTTSPAIKRLRKLQTLS
ncbi:uncharacterized protein LOC143574494 [Bidens hawaiensis]|uniref:uncharacterized protein LOC143574494 n=1 Tax=Bidens hawaiensis TaxID=980011 RepID=UPI004049CCFF